MNQRYSRTLAVSLRALTFALIVCCCGKSCWSQAEDPKLAKAQSDSSASVRCFSYNIRYANTRDGEDIWPNRKEAVAEALQTADVFGLQEALPSQLNDLQRLMPDFEWYGVGREDGKLGGETTAIGWSGDRFKLRAADTFWLSPTPNQVGSKGWDAALPRIASWVALLDTSTGMHFTILNTHFDHRGAEARALSAALIRKWCSDNPNRGPFVITGDLNAQLGSKPLNNLLSASQPDLIELIDTRQQAETKDPGPNSTWNGFRKIEADRRIDFILASKDVQVEQFTTLNPKTAQGRYASDHLPVMAIVRF